MILIPIDHFWLVRIWNVVLELSIGAHSFFTARLEPSVIRPVRDLSGHVLEPGAGPGVVHGDVLLGPV